MGNFATNVRGLTEVLQICEKEVYMEYKAIIYTQRRTNEYPTYIPLTHPG